jgi:hypothetical protein
MLFIILKSISFTFLVSHRYKFYMALQGTLLFADIDISNISWFDTDVKSDREKSKKIHITSNTNIGIHIDTKMNTDIGSFKSFNSSIHPYSVPSQLINKGACGCSDLSSISGPRTNSSKSSVKLSTSFVGVVLPPPIDFFCQLRAYLDTKS